MSLGKRNKNTVKQTKSKTAKRPTRPGLARSKGKTAAPARAFHKRVLLHPFTVMVMLCAGVLLGGVTLRSFAATPALDVTATVPAELPSSAATITGPGNAEHLSVGAVTVKGACPASSYVKLYRNTAFSGTSPCTSNAYEIQTNLSHGANELTAQVYNLTNQAGPSGVPVTVYYDPVTIAPAPIPTTVPTTISLAGVDSSSYKKSITTTTSENPTMWGWAPPFAKVTVTFHSDPKTCYTQADSTGRWSCTLASSLPAGTHHVDIQAVTQDGHILGFPTFQIIVSQTLRNVLAPKPTDPLILRADYNYTVHIGHQAAEISLDVAGGTAPYTIMADWGDGNTTSLNRDVAGTFKLSHSYASPSGANKNYTVIVRSTDQHGQQALMQLGVVVKGTGLVLLAKNTTFGAFLDALHRWLWLIWPAYVVVVLMAIGYYLGEREEYQHLMAKRRVNRGRAK
jgi:hypothetical protein